MIVINSNYLVKSQKVKTKQNKKKEKKNKSNFTVRSPSSKSDIREGKREVKKGGDIL